MRGGMAQQEGRATISIVGAQSGMQCGIPDRSTSQRVVYHVESDETSWQRLEAP